MKNYSVQSILDWLETKNYLSERHQAEAYVLTQTNINKVPIYIHLLMGIGAIIGCVCIIGLLFFEANIITPNDYGSMLISSGISLLIALSCYYLLRYQTVMLQSFGLQSALVFMIVAKILFVIGFDQIPALKTYLHDDWIWTLGIFIITVPTYFLFPNQIDRFLSTFALLLSLLANAVLFSTTNVGLFVYFVGLNVLCGFLFLWRRKSLSWVPLGYAVIMTLLATSIILLTFFGANLPINNSTQNTIPELYFNIAIGLALIILFLALGKERKTVIKLPTLLACLGICLITITSTPGILVSMGLLILGYAKHERAISIIGACFLCVFLVAFYYSMPYTLEYKSALLVSTGVILLGARFVVQMFKWDDGT